MISVAVKTLRRSLLLVPGGSSQPDYVAAPNIDKQFALIAADGLSHGRWHQFENEMLDLQARSTDYAKHYEQCMEIGKALAQVVLVVGDLHAALFHTLDGPVYTLFFGSFLQPIQLALGFKQIDPNKIEKCYEQAFLMVLMILGRMESRLMEEMVFQLSDGDINSLIERPNPAVVELFLASRFDKWVDEKVTPSTDPWFQFDISFVKVWRD
jgi:hypothetical protein